MAPVVDRYELGPIGTNCYVVRSSRSASEAVVVDPGGDVSQLRLDLARGSTQVAAILVTHCHYDHLGGVADLAEATGAPVSMAAAEAYVLAHPEDVYPGMGVRPYEADVLLAGDEAFEVAAIAFETLTVPGHSPAHLAFATEGVLFSGDVLFAGSVGRTDIPGASWDALEVSIRTLLERFPPDTTVYPGHGQPTTLAAELARNPFLADLRAQLRTP
jgi:hydroxyacylglutathione hydrolase